MTGVFKNQHALGAFVLKDRPVLGFIDGFDRRLAVRKKKEALERVRVVVETLFVKQKPGRVAKDISAHFRVGYGDDYFTRWNGTWGCSTRSGESFVDFFDMSEPERQLSSRKWDTRGRHRGRVKDVLHPLVKLGLLSAADAEVARMHIFDIDHAEQDKSMWRVLKWHAKRLGVKLVYPKDKPLDDSKTEELG